MFQQSTKMIWIILFMAILTFACFFIYPRLFYWKLQGIDQIIGISLILKFFLPGFRRMTFAELIMECYNEFPNKRYVGIYHLFTPTLLIRDPGSIKQVTVKDFEHFMDHRCFATEEVESLWEKNLFALKGKKWRDMRATLSPSFTSSKMKGMFIFISECAQEFVQYFENQNVNIFDTEMKGIFSRFTNDVIASAVFGIKCNSLQDENNEFYMMAKDLTNLSGFWKNIKLVVMMRFPTLAKLFGITVSDWKVINYFKNIVKSNVETRKREGIIRHDMIHLLMEAEEQKFNHETKNEQEAVAYGITNRRKMSDLTIDDLTAQAFIFFFAGFDTVSILLCFLAHELAVNPDVQKRLQDEIDSTWNEYKSLTYEALTKMKYLDMVINETLRKWPTAIMLDRLCTIPYNLEPVNDNEKPLYVPKGVTLLIPLYGIHRDPKHYSDPDKFDPERFSNENKHNINPYVFLPFGVGPRSCIGNRFALLEVKTLVFHLLKKMDIVITEKTENPVKLSRFSFNLQPEGGIWLGFTRRRN